MQNMERHLAQLPESALLEPFISQKAAKLLLYEYDTLYNVLMNTTDTELLRIKHLGNSRVHKIACLREIVRRLRLLQNASIKRILCAQDVFTYCADMQYLKQEQCRILLLDAKNGLIASRMITQGTINACVISAREIFCVALRHYAVTVILVHSHPSGCSKPSEEDKALTKSLYGAGRILGIVVLDHIIVGKGEYYSFKENTVLLDEDNSVNDGDLMQSFIDGGC